MTMRLALGTSTPTSTTVVATSTWVSPLEKADMAASFSRGFIFPWSSPTRRSGKTSFCSFSA